MRFLAITVFLLSSSLLSFAQPRQENFRSCARFSSFEQQAADRCRILARQLLEKGDPSRLNPIDRSAALTWKASEGLGGFGVRSLSLGTRMLVLEAIEVNPANAVALAIRGADRFARGMAKDGMVDLLEARRRDPKSSLVALILGVAYLEQQDYARAKAEFDLLVGAGKHKQLALAERAMVFARINDPKKSKRDMAAAVRMPAPHENALLRIVDVANELKWNDLALEAIERNRNFRSARVFRMKGDVLFDLKKYPDAIESYTASLLIDPTTAVVFTNRARANALLKRWEEAHLDLDQAEKFEPTNSRIPYYRGLILKDQKKPKEAISALTRAIDLAPGIAQYWYDRALLHDDTKQTQAALDDYTKTVALSPGHKFAHNNRGVAYEFLGRFDEAESAYLAAIQIDPNYIFAARNLVGIYGWKYEKSPDPIWKEKSLKNLELIFRLAPDDKFNFRARGRFFKRIRECGKAVDDLKTFHEWRPKDVSVLADLGYCLSQLERHSEVVLYLEKAIVISPEHASNLNNLAWSKVKLGQFAEGLDLAERSLALRPSNLPTLNTRAHAKAGLGDRIGAIADHREIIRRGKPEDSAVIDSTAALRAMGEKP